MIRAPRAKDVVERTAIQQRQGGIVLVSDRWRHRFVVTKKVRVQKTLKLGDNLPLFMGRNVNQLTTWLIIVITQLRIPLKNPELYVLFGSAQGSNN